MGNGRMAEWPNGAWGIGHWGWGMAEWPNGRMGHGALD